ncbi:MAG: hypothetical protein OEM49_12710 [Myxococcales bacterium]|nr:hypothetical protein [Myxococcales bacterium]
MNSACDALRAQLCAKTLDPSDIRARLDALAHAERLAVLRGLPRRAQSRLFRAVDGFLPLRLTALVAPCVPTCSEVRHHGVNSLPLLRRFEKRLFRPHDTDPDAPDVLFGYNHQALACLTGPGYFAARAGPRPGEIRIDYAELPAVGPRGGPRIRGNDAGLARLVYGQLIDTLRGVSEHVTVGSAARAGRELGSWFVLCRED